MRNPIVSKIGGDFAQDPSQVELSPAAGQLVAAALEGIGPGQVWDYHVHLAGLGTGGTGCWVNPHVFSLLHPVDNAKTNLFINAAGIEDRDRADQQYVERLLRLVRDFPGYGKLCVFALDRCYGEDGRLNEKDSKVYVPNEYVYELCRQYPDLFVPCISVHPYRPDALEQLDKWGKLGVKMLKWMPGVQGMDASHPLCEPFYGRMRAYGMVLITHTGKEETLYVTRFMPLNNPLLWRRPLEMGLKVIMAHCAGLGSNPDTDAPGRKLVKNYKLFLRLMEEPRYEGLLYGDIAAVTEINRAGISLATMLKRTDLHPRLVYGSDYPLPAINAVISTELLVKLGYLREVQQQPLREIYHKNPLLFDFVLKRTLKAPKSEHTRFAASVFTHKPELGIEPLPVSLGVAGAGAGGS